MNSGFKWGLTVSAALHAALLVSPLPEIIADGETPGRLIATSLLRVEAPVSDVGEGSREPGRHQEVAESTPGAVIAVPDRQEEEPAVQALKADTREEAAPVDPGYEEIVTEREEEAALEEPGVEMKETVVAVEGKSVQYHRPAPVLTFTVEETFQPSTGPVASPDRSGVREMEALPLRDPVPRTPGGRPGRGEERDRSRVESSQGEDLAAVRPPPQPDPTGGRSDPAHLLALIRSRILAARRYPDLARRKGWQGRAAVRFRIDGEGRPDYLELVESSGFTVLDKASLKAVDGGAPYPPVEGWITVPIVFRLKG